MTHRTKSNNLMKDGAFSVATKEFLSTNFLDDSECIRLRNEIFSLRNNWRAISPERKVFTLGYPSYLVNHLGMDNYYGQVRKMNQILDNTFGWVHDKFLALLEVLLESPVKKVEKFSRPGFLIQLMDQDPNYHKVSGGPHWDWDFLSLDWSPSLPSSIDPEQSMSFTIPIRLPKDGSGIWVWENITAMDTIELAQKKGISIEKATSILIQKENPRSYYYKQGNLISHPGGIVHGIIRSPKIRPGDERITMQAYALYHNNIWQVFF